MAQQNDIPTEPLPTEGQAALVDEATNIPVFGKA
jgi:hypothetical protein